MPQLRGYDVASLALLFGEVFLWAYAYLSSISGYLVPWIRDQLKHRDFWQHIASRRGQLMCSLGEECVVSFALSIHHIIAGGLMFGGYALEKPEMWVRGIAMEMGYEIVDTYALLRNAWPYSEMSLKKFKVITLLHHVPTLVLIPAMLRLGYHANPSIQTLGWSLIGAGGLSLFCEGLKKTRNLETQLGVWLFVHICNMIIMVGARFIVFPRASHSVLQTLAEDDAPVPLIFFTALGMGMMMVFNLVVFSTFLLKLRKYSGKLIKSLQ